MIGKDKMAQPELPGDKVILSGNETRLVS